MVAPIATTGTPEEHAEFERRRKAHYRMGDLLKKRAAEIDDEDDADGDDAADDDDDASGGA